MNARVASESSKSSWSSRSAVAYAAVALAASSWGTWPVILRKVEASGPIPASLESAIVMLTMTIVSGFAVFADRVRNKATFREWLAVIWLGFSDSANIVLFFRAYQATSVAIAVLTHYLTPVFVALAVPFALKEKLTRRSVAAIAIAFTGLVLLLQPWSVEHRPSDWIGALCGAGSAVFYASNVIINKRIARAFSASEAMFYHGLVAVPVLVLLVPIAAWSLITPKAIGLLTIGAVGPGAIAGLLFVGGLRRLPANHASTLTLLEPCVAMICGGLFFGESIGLHGALGGALIITGAVIVMARKNDEIAN